MEQYYRILEVSETTTLTEVKKAFRKLSLIYHPDKNKGSKESEEKFKKILEAYNEIIKKIEEQEKCTSKTENQSYNNDTTKRQKNTSDKEFYQEENSIKDISINNVDWWNSLSGEWMYYFNQTYKINGSPDEFDFEQINSLNSVFVNMQTIHYNEIKDLKPLSYFNALKAIEIQYMPITDIEPLRNLDNLEVIKITTYKANIKSLLPLSKTKKIRELEIFSTQIDSLEPITKNSQLERLILIGDHRSYAPLNSLTPLDGLNLKELCLNYTLISDISVLGRMANIEFIDISYSKVRDLTPLFYLKKLKKLEIRNLQISKEQIEKFQSLNPQCEVII